MNNNNEKFKLIAHYIKDLSFENPNYQLFFDSKEKFEIKNFTVNISSKKVSNDVYEVQLEISTKKEVSDKTLFVIELTYAGLFNFFDIKKEKIILVDVPEVLYQYVKKILSEIIRIGGFSKIEMPEINFLDIYNKEKKLT